MGIFISTFCVAQNKEAFKVLATKGNNTISNPGDAAALPISLGNKLYDHQTVRVAEGGYLSLIHATGRSLELKKPGTFAVKELMAQLSTSNTGMAAKYANFVIGELTKNDVDINKEHRKNMTVTGSVERSTESAGLIINMPKTVQVLETPFTVKVMNGLDEGKYTYTVMNMFEETLSKETFQGTTVNIPLPDRAEIREQGALLMISDNTNPKVHSKTISITLSDDKSKERIRQDIQLIEEEMGGQSAVSHLVVATYLEEKRLFLEAEKHLQMAMNMEPSVETYQLAYRHFHKRNGLE